MKPSSVTPRQKVPIQVVAVIACIALLSPSQARGQILDIVNIFSAIESTITGLIGGSLTDIRSFQTQVQTLYEEVVWPVASIAQAQSFIAGTIGSYRGWMSGVYNLPIASAQLTNPTQLESAILSQNVTSFPQMNTGYNGTYRNLPTAQQAPMYALQITDINDALAKDALAQSMASDQANDQMLSLANQMESGAATAAPGSSPYLTASALTATLQTQAFQLKLMASLLREESAQLAHQNARYKELVRDRNRLNQNLQQILTTGR
jgi:hypothetical protein